MPFLCFQCFPLDVPNYLQFLCRQKNTAVPEGATEGTPKYKELIGKTGETITELRPVGKAKIGDKIYDVTSEDGFVNKGVGIEVVAAEGVKITVRKI